MSREDPTPGEKAALAWEQALGNEFWKEISDDDLYYIEGWLWGTHEDALSEWTRREMQKKARSR